jgi:hypothetical protein
MLRLLSLVLIAGSLMAADAPTVTCKPVMITTCAELPASIDFHTRPMGYELGIKIAYLIEGEDLIGFKDESLSITSITTADGKDISKKRNGKAAWKQDSFPKTTDDGKYGIFAIEISENAFGKTDGLTVNGSIVALTGGDRQTKKLTFKVGDAKVEDVGGLKVSLTGSKKSAENEGPFGGFGGGGFGVQVTGDIAKVAELAMSEGDKNLDRQGSHWSGTQKTWNFAKPTGDTVTVEITWWNKLAPVTVTIGKK